MCELSVNGSSICLARILCLYFIVIVSTLGFTCCWKQDKLPWEITLWLNDWYSTKRWEKRRNQINFRFIHGYIIYYLSYLLHKKNLIVIDLDRGCPITGIEFQLLAIGFLENFVLQRHSHVNHACVSGFVLNVSYGFKTCREHYWPFRSK